MDIYSRFNVPFRRGFTPGGPSLTQQHFGNEVNINSIIAKYNRTGFMIDPGRSPSNRPQFGDFVNVPTYQEAQNILLAADQAFADLPSQLRKRFDNDPAKMLEFLSIPENRDEAISLGLVNPVPVSEPIAVHVVEKSAKASKQSEQSTA